MPRKSLHSIIDLLDEFEVFSDRKVTIVVTNGIDVKLKYNPPLADDEPEVIERSLLILEATRSRIQ
jgi:hypothetical protein